MGKRAVKDETNKKNINATLTLFTPRLFIVPALGCRLKRYETQTHNSGHNRSHLSHTHFDKMPKIRRSKKFTQR